MEQAEFSNLSILLCGFNVSRASLLRSVMRVLGIVKVSVADSVEDGKSRLSRESFDAVIVEFGPSTGGRQIIELLRKGKIMTSHMLPVIAVLAEPNAVNFKLARDAGTNDVLVWPISPVALQAKLAAALLRPRRFILASHYRGPDRRSGRYFPHPGPDRRKSPGYR